MLFDYKSTLMSRRPQRTEEGRGGDLEWGGGEVGVQGGRVGKWCSGCLQNEIIVPICTSTVVATTLVERLVRTRNYHMTPPHLILELSLQGIVTSPAQKATQGHPAVTRETK